MSLTPEDKQKIKTLVQQHANQPLLAIYVFGSRVSGETHASSDLDVALLGSVPLQGADAFEIKAALSSVFRCDIDLVDLLRADSVSKAQIVSSGEVVFVKDPRELAFFETRVFSEYALLNEERAGILQDILQRGSVHG